MLPEVLHFALLRAVGNLFAQFALQELRRLCATRLRSTPAQGAHFLAGGEDEAQERRYLHMALLHGVLVGTDTILIQQAAAPSRLVYSAHGCQVSEHGGDATRTHTFVICK